MDDASEPDARPKVPTWLIETGAVLVLVVNMYSSVLIAELRGDARGPNHFAFVAGRVLGQLLLAALVVGIAALFRRGRTRRGRALVLLVAMFVVLFGNWNAGKAVQRTARATGAPAREQPPA